MDVLAFPPWIVFFAALIIFAIFITAWFEYRHQDRISQRRRKLQEALEAFRIVRHYEREDGSKSQYLYSADNSTRLVELENQIIKRGQGSASWLYFMPERRLFFILELVAIEPAGDMHFMTNLHPIKPERARKVLTRYPQLYKEIFREEI